MKDLCWWSIGDGEHAKYLQSAVWSARNIAKIQDPIHVWSDMNIHGAETHPVGTFSKSHYLFKFSFLEKEVKKLPYTWFAFFDADTWFLQNPTTLDYILKDDPIHVTLESEVRETSIRKDWWGIPNSDYIKLMREMGVKTDKIYNTNAGFWIIHKDVISHAVNLAMEFWNKCQKNGWTKTTEEPPLAYIGHLLAGDINRHVLQKTKFVWASDWTGVYKDKLPEKIEEWEFTDYMNDYKYKIRTPIVHVMRSKHLLLKHYEEVIKPSIPIKSKQVITPNVKSDNVLHTPLTSMEAMSALHNKHDIQLTVISKYMDWCISKNIDPLDGLNNNIEKIKDIVKKL